MKVSDFVDMIDAVDSFIFKENYQWRKKNALLTKIQVQ